MSLSHALDKEGNLVPLRIGDPSKGLRVQNAYQQKVATGGLFYLSHIYEAVGDGDSADLLIQTGLTKDAFGFVDVSICGNARLYVYLSTEFEGGTPLPIFGARSYGEVEVEAQAWYGATVLNDGIRVSERVLPGGAKKDAVGRIYRNATQRILGAEKTWMIRVVNTSGNTMDMSINMDFYEDDAGAGANGTTNNDV